MIFGETNLRSLLKVNSRLKEFITVNDFVSGTEKVSAVKNLETVALIPLTVVWTGIR